MNAKNNVNLIGNLTRDIETRKTPGGTVVADMGIGVNESFKNGAGETVEKTVFVDVVIWGSRAEVCAKYLKKGSKVAVAGSLQLDQWENEAGEKRSKLRVRADDVQFLDKKEK